jgi:hypothetical protein
MAVALSVYGRWSKQDGEGSLDKIKKSPGLFGLLI